MGLKRGFGLHLCIFMRLVVIPHAPLQGRPNNCPALGGLWPVQMAHHVYIISYHRFLFPPSAQQTYSWRVVCVATSQDLLLDQDHCRSSVVAEDPTGNPHAQQCQGVRMADVARVRRNARNEPLSHLTRRRGARRLPPLPLAALPPPLPLSAASFAPASSSMHRAAARHASAH